MIMLAGIIGIFADVLRAVAHGWFFMASHNLAECILLIGGGLACVLAEIKPSPVVSENAPYLNKLSGRSVFYVFMGMYILGRKVEEPLGTQAWMDILIGLYTLGVAVAGMMFAYKLSGLPQPLQEPVMMGEMYSSEAVGGAPLVAPLGP